MIEKSPYGYSVCLDCDTKWRNFPKEEILVRCCGCDCRKLVDFKNDKWFLVKDDNGYHYGCSYRCLRWYGLGEECEGRDYAQTEDSEEEDFSVYLLVSGHHGEYNIPFRCYMECGGDGFSVWSGNRLDVMAGDVEASVLIGDVEAIFVNGCEFAYDYRNGSLRDLSKKIKDRYGFTPFKFRG